jgi:hypothetical protein
MRLGVTPADLHALARLIRRRELGLCTETQLTERLYEVLNALQALMVEWRPLLAGLRHRPSAAMRECDDAISAAHRLGGGRQFKSCLIQLKRARNVLAHLQGLLDAYDEHGRAAEAFRGLTELLGSQQLCQLLTVETIARLLAESDRLLASGRSRQAGFIARLCRHKALALSEAAGDEGRGTQELSAAIERQAAFFRQTEAFAASPADFRLRRAFERLPELLAHRRVALVTRLVADIECELASRRAVWASLRHSDGTPQKPGGAARPPADELKRIIREESWEQAANHLLRQTLAALSSEAAALRPAIGHISQQMEAIRGDVSRTQAEAAVGVN